MRKLFLLFAILLVLVSWMAWTYRVRLVSETLTRNLGVPTHVADVELSTHGIILRGFTLGAPKDSTESPALVVDAVRLVVSPSELWNDPVHISDLTLENVYVILDMSSWDGFSRNWASVFERLGRQISRPSHAAEPSHEAAADKRYIIDRLVVTNIHASLENRNIPALSGKTPALARLELRNVGAQSPRSLQHTMELILGAILERASAPHPQLSHLADGILQNADEELKSVLKAIKGEQRQDTQEQGMWQRVRSIFDWSK